MQFKIRRYHAATGHVTNCEAEGENAAAVEAAMEQQGFTVLKITAARDGLRIGKRARFDVPLFCEELRTLLSSGMSLIEAVDTLCAKNTGDEKFAILSELRQRLFEGKPFSAALELNAYPFAPLLIASIRASERSSRIQDALDEFTRYEKVGKELRAKIVSAAIYPSLVIAFGALVSLFMLAYVVPRFAKVYDDFGPALSMPTQILLKIGKFMDQYFILLACTIIALITVLVTMYRSGYLARVMLGLLGQFGVTKYYLERYQLARIYQTMSMLLKGGYTLTDAIPLARNLAFDGVLAQKMSNARAMVMEGKRLSTAFAAHQLTDTVAERLLQVGERSGNLTEVMDLIEHGYRREFTLFVERTTRLVEPILLMSVGVMIGAIIVLMYMPIFDLASGT